MAGRERRPRVPTKRPIIPTRPRQVLPTSSEDNTMEHVPIVARPMPLTNLNAEYIHMLVENTVAKADRDIIRHDTTSMFLRPREESASVAKMMPPTRHPM